MGIVILRSMGGVHLDENQMQEINLAEKEEIRRVVDRSFRRRGEGDESFSSLSAQASVGDRPPVNLRAAALHAEERDPASQGQGGAPQ